MRTSRQCHRKPTSPRQSDPIDANGAERRYEPLSPEAQESVLQDLKDCIELGLLSPTIRPSIIGIHPDRFASNGLTFDGNPLPEFHSVARNVLDCFAAAVISIPSREFPPSPVRFQSRLDDDGRLILRLSTTLGIGIDGVSLTLTPDEANWIACYLYRLAKIKSMSVGRVYWDSNDPRCDFSIDYPGQMVRSRVLGLGEPGDDGRARWPECELIFDRIDSASREKAKNAVDLINA